MDKICEVTPVGFTELSRTPTDREIIADVVFVHGLGGHPKKTWTYEGSSVPKGRRRCRGKWFGSFSKTSQEQYSMPSKAQDKKQSKGCFWPADLMPRDFDDVRVLTYGYNSHVAGFFKTLNMSTITQHAQDLLQRLTNERYDCQERPLIFVAHSLGGLLVKGALNESAQYNTGDPERRISANCHMVMFFGTPHRGSDLAAWGTSLANIATVLGVSCNRSVLDQLGRESEILLRLERDFESILAQHDPQGKRFRIYTFQEAKGIAGPISHQVVPDSASRFNRRDIERLFRINENHMDMCKFKGETDENYKVFRRELMHYLRPIREFRRSSKNILDSSVIPGGSRVIEPSGDPVEQYLEAIGLPGSVLASFKAQPPREVSTITTDVSWFIENPDFESWDREHSTGILWLRNKSQQENEQISRSLWKQRVDRAADGGSETTIHYPLPSPSDSHPTKQRKSNPVLHVAHTLIGQLFSENRARIDYVTQQYPYHTLRKEISIKYTEAEQPTIAAKVAFKILFYALTAISDVQVNVIVTGIDELGTEKYKLIERLWDLYSNLKAPDSRPGIVVKILFTSGLINASQTRSSTWNFLDRIPYIEKDKEANDCLQSLRVVNFDFKKRFHSVFQAGEKTGKWLWKNDDYLKWQDAEVSSLLLIEGKPGSGKSTLVKRILESITSRRERGSGELSDLFVAYFFYSYRGGALETSHRMMLQSILYQLLSQDLTKLYPLFRTLYRERVRRGVQEWKMEDLIQIMESLKSVDTDKRIFVFLDGMDESDGDEWRPKIFDMMVKMCATESTCIVKALIATRPLGDKDTGGWRIRSRDSQFKLVLQRQNHEDIESLVTMELDKITQKEAGDGGLPSSDIDYLKNYIVDNAQGVFAWVSLVLKEVRKQHEERGLSPDELEELQEMLPPELEEFYKRIVRRLHENTSKREQQHTTAEARKLLMCVSFARRSLTLDELRDAFAVPSVLEARSNYSMDKMKKRRNMAFERRIRYACGDLLNVTDSYVQLFHETVRDFLLDRDRSAEPLDITQGMSNVMMSSICTRYLMLSLSQEALNNVGVSPADVMMWRKHDYEKFVELLNDRPLLAYAVKSLLAHKSEAEKSNDGSEEYSEALSSMNAEYFQFASAMRSLECPRCILGGPLTLGIQPNNAASFQSNALIAAVMRGQKAAMENLIKLGTDVNGINEGNNVLPLFAACINRQTEAVKLLLHYGADCQARDQYGETALHKAALNGEGPIVRLLLQHGAYVEAENFDSERPLHLAALYGHVSVVKELLERRCTVDCSDRFGGTPLHKAAANGHVEVAQLLLERGADVDEDGEYRGTPLHRAVDKGHEAMVKLLLKHDAAVDYASNYGGTALHSAAAGGREPIVKLLLEHEANVNIKDHYGYTPRMWAAMNQQEDVVKLLERYDHSSGDSSQESVASQGELFRLFIRIGNE